MSDRKIKNLSASIRRNTPQAITPAKPESPNSSPVQMAPEFWLTFWPELALLRVVEEICKIKVFHIAFEPSGSAACTLDATFGAAILLNAKNVRRRRNFDLAHELFHLLTWKSFRRPGEESFTEASAHEEKLATCFARNLLMPQEPLRIAINSQLGSKTTLTFDDLFEVARQFDVSVDALLWQMSFVFNRPKGWVSENSEKLKGQIAFWDQRQSDTLPLRPLRFDALAAEALRKGYISTGRYAEYLGITCISVTATTANQSHWFIW